MAYILIPFIGFFFKAAKLSKFKPKFSVNKVTSTTKQTKNPKTLSLPTYFDSFYS